MLLLAQQPTAQGCTQCEKQRAGLGNRGRCGRGAPCILHCIVNTAFHLSNCVIDPVLAHTLLPALCCSCCAAVLCCDGRYCFESDVPINMEGQEALLDWALLRMGLTGERLNTTQVLRCVCGAM